MMPALLHLRQTLAHDGQHSRRGRRGLGGGAAGCTNAKRAPLRATWYLNLSQVAPEFKRPISGRFATAKTPQGAGYRWGWQGGDEWFGLRQGGQAQAKLIRRNYVILRKR
eukprot:6205272-Pleurochrysis_carterae.AAC.1